MKIDQLQLRLTGAYPCVFVASFSECITTPSIANGVYGLLAAGYDSSRTREPVSSSELRFDRIFGHPPDTAVMSFEDSRSIVWVMDSLTADPLGSSSIVQSEAPSATCVQILIQFGNRRQWEVPHAKLLLGSSSQDESLRRTQRLVVPVNTAYETARAAHPVVKLRAYPFKMFASGLRFLDGDHPTNPFIASERRQTFPYRQGFAIRA